MKWFKKKNASPDRPSPAQANAMPLSHFLPPERIRILSGILTKEQIFASLASLLPYPKMDAALQAVWERENSISTVIAPGISFPHARLVDLPEVVAALGLYPPGIHEPDQQAPVRAVLLFLGPANNMKRNLDFLASASFVFQSEGLVDNILALDSPHAVWNRIREIESQG